jgi:cyclophilin family peptidyl-prolyl cis-trans isomerase
MGQMIFKFFPRDAPKTCEQIQRLVTQGYYDGKEFYRVVKGHVIQTGGGDADPLPAEFNSHPHIRGTVGLARGNDPDSGDSSFYICLAPRPHLDGEYTVFGQLIEGEDVLMSIGNTEVNEKFIGESKIAFHEPREAIVIHKAEIHSLNSE